MTTVQLKPSEILQKGIEVAQQFGVTPKAYDVFWLSVKPESEWCACWLGYMLLGIGYTPTAFVQEGRGTGGAVSILYEACPTLSFDQIDEFVRLFDEWADEQPEPDPQSALDEIMVRLKELEA